MPHMTQFHTCSNNAVFQQGANVWAILKHDIFLMRLVLQPTDIIQEISHLIKSHHDQNFSHTKSQSITMFLDCLQIGGQEVVCVYSSAHTLTKMFPSKLYIEKTKAGFHLCSTFDCQNKNYKP